MPISATDNTKSKQMLDLLLSIPTKSSSADSATDESFAELLAPPAIAASKPRESSAATSSREKLSAEPAKRSRRPDEVLPASSGEAPAVVADSPSEPKSEAATDATNIAPPEETAVEPVLTEEALSEEAERAAAEAAAVAQLAITNVTQASPTSEESLTTELKPTEVVDADAPAHGDASKNLWNQATTVDAETSELTESASVEVAATSYDAIATASDSVASDTETSVTTLDQAESNVSEELSATISLETVGESQEVPAVAEISVETASVEATAASDTQDASQLDRDQASELESSITSSSAGTVAGIETTTATDGSTSDRGSESSHESGSSERATAATSEELSTSEMLTSQSGHGATTSETSAISATQPSVEAAAAAAASGNMGRTPNANGTTSSNTANAQPLQAPPAKLPAQALTAGTAKPVAAAIAPPEIDPAKFLSRVTKAFATARERGGPVQLRLNPPELGALKIEVQVQDGSMTARLEAETSAARAAILENLPQLRERLAEQGIRIDRFDVELLPDQSQQNLANQQGNSTPEQNSMNTGRTAARPKIDANPVSGDSSVAPVVANDRLNVVV